MYDLPLGITEYISLLRRFLHNYLEKEQIYFSESLWHQARIIISNYAERIQGYRRKRTEQQTSDLAYAGINLISSFKLENIAREIEENIPSLGVKTFYIVLYDNKEPPYKTSIMLTGHERKDKKLESFPIDDIIPSFYFSLQSIFLKFSQGLDFPRAF